MSEIATAISTVGLTGLALIVVIAISGLAFWKPIAPKRDTDKAVS